MPAFDPALLAAYTVAALALSLTPGPDMLFCLANGIAHGPRGGLAAAAGIGAALLVHVVAVTAGLAGVVTASPLAFEVLRWAGALYLLYLAWQAFRAPPAMLDHGAAPAAGRADLRRVFRGGFVTCLLNPKLLLFFVAFLPQFVQPAAGSVSAQMLILSLILVVPGLLINAGVGVSGGGIARMLARNPAVAWWQNRLVGGIFLALALRLALSDRG